MIDKMYFVLNQNSMNRKCIFGLILFSLLFVFCTSFNATDSDAFDLAKREVLLRRIGHEVLLQSGDSTSRILPIEKISDHEYQIKFENTFTFKPEALVTISQRFLIKDVLSDEYLVNVLNCNNSSIVYGFTISKNKKDAQITCIGRKQPKACYTISVKFKTPPKSIGNYLYLWAGLCLLVCMGFIFSKRNKAKKAIVKEEYDKRFNIGLTVFDVQKRELQFHDATVDLTKTETRLLLIFASSPNAIIERSRLQKEIWEDEGVIVGRSLDMFISKLRKKLEQDSNISLVVVRGKGYKLEVTT